MFLPRSHSHHSLLSALPQIKKLITDAKNKGYTTIALTDEDVATGLAEFYDECLKQEIKPVLGTTLRIPNQSSGAATFGSHKNFSKVSILPKNKDGYRQVLELVSIARTIQEQPAYHITIENLQEKLAAKKDFFILICGNDHEIIVNLRNNKPSQAEQVLKEYVGSLGAENLLIEAAYSLKDDTNEDLKKVNLELYSLAQKCGVRMLISPASRYLEKEDEEAFRVVLAIRNQSRLSDVELSREFNLPSSANLKEEFRYLPDILNTAELEKEFNIEIRTDFDKHSDEAFFPKFKLEPGQDAAKRLTYETYIGLLTRFSPEQNTRQEWQNRYKYEDLETVLNLAKEVVPDTSKLLGYPSDYWGAEKTIGDYVDRIEYELGIIIQKGYPEYFLVFGDIMRFCRENGIVTNTRGSAAGSLVGYLNEINVLDPLIYNLPFERFLNPYRPSPPDIDGDFADDKREAVINYIKTTYGAEKVSQILTFGTMLPRAGVRDVGRALGVSYKKCDRLAKLIPIAPQGRKTTFAWAFETSSEFKEVYDSDDESRRVIDIATKIEGNYRHASSHAAGVLITPTKLTDYTALQWDTEHKGIVAQYDMKVCEKVGLIKLDILGITNLAILGNAVELAQERHNLKIDLLNIDIQDKKAFELLSKGRTMGTFQLSSSGMTRHLVSLGPTRVEDLMAMVALYRPGPMANIPEFIKRKKDPKKSKYYAEKMKDWMEGTYGILVYQEDLLLTAINIAGFDWGEADTLRKGMGKKIAAVIESQHPKFVEGCVKNGGLTKDKAEEIWQAFLPFAAYGFNKGHSASYGMVAYWTAYMKAEYPVEFMTAFMTAESNVLEKIAEAIAECRELGITVLPPDINESYNNFSVVNDTTIRYGLASVKNLGSDVIKFIIESRTGGGEFKTLEDFMDRISNFSAFNKRSIEALILSGSLDELGARVLGN